MRCGDGYMTNTCDGFAVMKTWKDKDFDPWREGIDAKIGAIIKLQLTLADEADTIAADLVAIGEKQAKVSGEIYTAETRIAGNVGDIKDKKEAVNTEKARVALATGGGNADERKHGLVIALADSEDYQIARKALVEAERIKMVEEALLNELEREYASNKAQLRAVISRLDVLAARIKGE